MHNLRFFDSIQRSENDSFLTAKFCTPFRLQKSFFFTYFFHLKSELISLFKTKKIRKNGYKPILKLFWERFLKTFFHEKSVISVITPSKSWVKKTSKVVGFFFSKRTSYRKFVKILRGGVSRRIFFVWTFWNENRYFYRTLRVKRAFA